MEGRQEMKDDSKDLHFGAAKASLDSAWVLKNLEGRMQEKGEDTTETFVAGAAEESMKTCH